LWSLFPCNIKGGLVFTWHIPGRKNDHGGDYGALFYGVGTRNVDSLTINLGGSLYCFLVTLASEIPEPAYRPCSQLLSDFTYCIVGRKTYTIHLVLLRFRADIQQYTFGAHRDMAS